MIEDTVSVLYMCVAIGCDADESIVYAPIRVRHVLLVPDSRLA